MTLEEEVVGLRAENADLKRLLAETLERLAVAQARVVELEGKAGEPPKPGGDFPSFVKPNRRKASGPKAPRKKRDKEHNHGRKRETPTRTVRHSLDECPLCKTHLHGESLDYRRQVIDLPEPMPVEVVEHRVIRRYCPKCEKWRSPKLDLRGVQGVQGGQAGGEQAGEGQVLGRGRIGVRLISLIATLRHSLRLPFERIQWYLETFHGLKVSVGELVYLLDQVRKATSGAVESLKAELRASKVLHADETGWREDGVNGYLWSFSTPGGPDGGDTGKEAIRYYEFDPSRSQAVPRRILADKFKGHLVSDFYCGYNDYPSKHQRCWIHMFRDLHELKAAHADKPEVLAWAESLRALYDEAKEWLEGHRGPSPGQGAVAQAAREMKYVSLVGRVHQLGLLYARDKTHPAWALCKRVLRHEDELLQFVLVDGLASDNNLAERSIRPLVVVRKISGGTRSTNGTKTRMVLATLFETWHARGLNPFQECLKLLQRPIPTAP